MKLFLAIGLLVAIVAADEKCVPSVSTASGGTVKKDSFCPGELMFEDNFNVLDHQKWTHESTLGGGGNWEFQWYTNNRSNSFTQNGNLHIRPSLTSDIYGEAFLSSGTLNIQGDCTDAANWGCERSGNPSNIINPIRSARLRTRDTFQFKYGKLEVRAKLPAGDWLWPAIWLMPARNAYGSWPSSGEIDVIESRGNRNLVLNGVNIGPEQVGSTLHYGPYPELNAYPTAHFSRNSAPGNGYNNAFHRYQMEWTPGHIKFSIDDVETGTVPIGQGMWQRGGFAQKAPAIDNPWKAGQPQAPFDQEFYLILNLAVGGVNYFPDNASNPGGKPWTNNSPTAMANFWNQRGAWLKTWNIDNKDNSESSLLVDYVRIYAL